MKPSFFNNSTTLQDDTTLLFNFYTLNLLVFNRSEWRIVTNILRYPDKTYLSHRASPLKELLINKGFIINDEIDEHQLLNMFRLISVNQKKKLTITIAPSLECNFRCIYCYEKASGNKMTPEIVNALINFVSKKVRREGNLYITWFGGEPLLQIDIIEQLSKAFIAICNINSTSYGADIITNGYLLNKKTVEKLKDLKIKRAQVTLDGPPAVHNKRRTTKWGGKTFKIIFENIVTASEIMNISVRMNVDMNNREYIFDMLKILKQEGLENKIGFYLGQTFPYTKACSDVASYCLTNEDFSLLGLETNLEMLKQGFTSSFGMPRSKNIFCLAESENSYVITPNGGIVKCWNDIDNPEKETGHLLNPNVGKMKENNEKWRKRNPFKLECKSCILLPVCMGGCPYIHTHTGNLDCHDWKHNLKESIAFYYYLKRVEQEGQIIEQFLKVVDYVKKTKSPKG